MEERNKNIDFQQARSAFRVAHIEFRVIQNGKSRPLN